MPTKYTMIFGLTTNPDVKTDASPHSGGWSESYWLNAGGLNPADPRFDRLHSKRVVLMPVQAFIQGYRIAEYTAVGNKFQPIGTNSGKLAIRGNAAYDCDIPQMALMFEGKSGGRNTSHFNIAAIPDEQIANGEYQPKVPFKTQVTNFCNNLVNDQWCFAGRDLTQPSFRVISIVGDTVTLSGDAGGVAGQDYLIFNHVKDNDKDAVKGSYLIKTHVGPVYTLAGLTATVQVPSGTARVDKPSMIPFASVKPNRVKVRKVGRPFEVYRGRASKK